MVVLSGDRTIYVLNSNNGMLKYQINLDFHIKKVDILKNDYVLVTGPNFIEILDAYTGKPVQRYNYFKTKIINILDVVERADRNLAVYDGEQVYLKEIGKLNLNK